MTMPDERSRAVRYARDFLRSLLNPKVTPKVPRSVRMEAYRVLRHFPADHDVNRAAKKLPDTWGALKYED
jgi:hypothetical protein